MTLQQELHNLKDVEFLENENLTSYTTFKLNSVGDLLKVKTVEALQEVLPLLTSHQRSYLVVGWGANQILPAQCQDIIIHLEFSFDMEYFNTLRSEYVLPASLGLNHLTSHAVKFGLKGWEVFTGIPASLGGAIYMNAGTNLGEIGNLIKKVQLLTPAGIIREEVMTKESFSYRKNHFVKPGEVIIGAVISHLGTDEAIPQKIREYLEYRKKTQPLTTKNCGCVFKNPLKELPAGKLIDLLQLKGVGVNQLRISTKHGNFMENAGKANWDEFQSLVNLINFEMDHFYGIEFELEVKIPYH
ncbi:MAG: FAD-binding protein [Bdellovibrionales bacterium]|nr:FAD-binding protein [Bdellovibrionales bacterium]